MEKAIEGDEQEEMAVVGGGDSGDANEEANSNEMKTETTGRCAINIMTKYLQ